MTEITTAAPKKLRGLDVIPLFPLGVALLPRMTQPLHIFEERYKTMVTECLYRNDPFGIVYYSDTRDRRVHARRTAATAGDDIHTPTPVEV